VESSLLEKTTSSSIRSSLLEKTTTSSSVAEEEEFSIRGAWDDGTPRKRSREERVCLRLRNRFGSCRSIFQIRVRC